MPPISRREFLECTALTAGAALAWRSGLSAADAGAVDDRLVIGLTARTAAARARFARVAAFIARAHPQLHEQIVLRAEEAMRGLLLLPGSRELSAVGDPPDWLMPRYGDEEYLWGLHRMMHWKTLLQAYALTGDQRYPQKVVAELDDWIARARPPTFRHPDGTPNPEVVTNSGPPAWRSLEMGIRMFDSWPTVLECLAGTEFLPPERLARVAETMRRHAEGLSLLTPLLWPEADHNHYFMEMLGLLSVTVYLPELADADRWRAQAMTELQRCVARQFTEDGGHIEGCPTYHNVCMVLLARFIVLIGGQVSDLVRRVATLGTEHIVHSMRPTGNIVPWGDSTRSNQVEAAIWMAKANHDATILSDLAGLMGVERVRDDCAPYLWEIDDPETLFANLARAEFARELVRFDRGNDQAMLRTSWKRDALSVYFACHSPLTPGSGHQHVDLGGFDFTALGRTLVVDPGVFTYRECEERRRFKSAAYHSVLMVDEREPFEYLSRWRYSPQREGRITKVTRDVQTLRVDSFHRNYEPVICRRAVAIVDGRWLVVIDVVEGLAEASTVQILFHLDSTHVARNDERRRIDTADDDVCLSLAVSAGLACTLLPGEVSEKPDTSRPSTRVKFFDRGGPARRAYFSVLAPYRAGEPAPAIERVAISPDQESCAFAIDGREFQVPCVL